MKNILTEIDKLNNKQILIKKSKNYPRFIRHPRRNFLPALNLSTLKNEEKKHSFISSLFKNTSFNNEYQDRNEKKFISLNVHKKKNNVIKTIDNETSRSIELSEFIREGLMETNKIKINNMKCSSMDRKDDIKTKLIINEFDEKDIKKFPIISKFKDIGKVTEVHQIEEVLYNKKNQKMFV